MAKKSGGKASRRKGFGFEREIVNQAKESGLESKRAYASNGASLGMHEEVDLVVSGKKIQAKRRRSMPVYLRPTEHIDAVIFREDHGESMVLITWFEYLDLLKDADNGRQDRIRQQLERSDILPEQEE